MKNILGLIFAVFLLLSFFVKTVFADSSWTIDQFDSQISPQTDGKVNVTETVSVNFNSLQKHGIFRDIPYIYQDENGSETYTQIEVVKVQRNQSAEKYQVSKTNGYVEIKIGNPDKTISGTQTYTISYTAAGILKPFETYDELYWNVTGNNWEVPIKNITAAVTIPKSQIEKSDCFLGIYQSTEPCKTQQGENSITFTSNRPLDQNEGLTFVIGYQKGLFPILTVQAPEPFEKQLTKPLTLAVFFTTLVTGLGIIFSLWYSKGRDFWLRRKNLFDPSATKEKQPIGAHETIVVEYSPPENLRPAELGTLVDQKADTLDVTATIIDLATRGYMTIAQKPKKWLFGKTDYIFTKTQKGPKALQPFESYLLDEIFKSNTIVSLSSLKTKFYDELAEVKKKLYQQVVDKNLFIKNPESVRTLYIVAGILTTIAGVVLFFVGLANQIALISAFGAPLAVIGVLLIAISNFMPRRTAAGHELYRRVKGYELFIATAEKHRQKFFENKNLFNEILPYAITFGLVEKFARAMKDIGLKPTQTATGWYVPTHPFVFDSFASDINSFSSSITNVIASTPSKSGGFSGGGGSSGGGFGGGGGGSW